MPDWRKLQYLQRGNSRQQRAFEPVLAGTIPLAIEVPASDLGVICNVPLASRASFEQLVRARYGHLSGFRVAHTRSRGHGVVVCNLSYTGVAIKVVGQALPPEQQYALRHLAVEAASLQVGGEAWRTAVQQLKQWGMKTEPAFAQLLGLSGDPYEALLTLEGKSAAALATQLAGCSRAI